MLITKQDRIILAICEHVTIQNATSIRSYICIRIEEPAVGKAVVPALEVVEARFAVVVIATVAKRVDVPDEGRIRGLFAVSIVHGIVAPRAVGAAAQRNAADNDDDLWLCAGGCTHHSDHLSISQRAVQQHRPRDILSLSTTGYGCKLFQLAITQLIDLFCKQLAFLFRAAATRNHPLPIRIKCNIGVTLSF